MANELTTKFIFDDADGKKVDALFKNLSTFDQKLNKLSNASPNLLGKGSESTNKSLQKVEKEIAKFQSQQLKEEKLLTKQLEKEAKARADFQIKEAKRANLEAIKDIKAFQKESADASQRRQTRAGNVLTGLTVAGAGTAFLVKEGIDSAKEATKANQALESSATEAGKSYAVLAQEAKKFGNDALISNTAAARSTADLQRLLTLAGEGNQFEKYSKGFLDVAAARGVEFKELTTLFQGIIAGTDDALNRFGKQDPSKLAEQYAKSIGKTVKELTEQEKILSRLKAFDADFQLFEGTNANRINGISGQADQAAKSIEDLKTNFGLALTQSLEFQNGLSAVNQALKALAGYDPIDIRLQFNSGKTPQQVAEEIADSGLNQSLDVIKSLASIVPATFLGVYDLITEGSDVAARNLASSLTLNSLRQQRIDALLPKLKQEQTANDDQQRLATIKALENDLSKFKDVKQIQAEKIALEKDTQAKLAEIRQKALEEEKRQFEERQRKIKEFQNQIKSLRSDVRGIFVDVNQSNPFVSLFDNANEAIKRVRDNTNGLAGDLKNNLLKQTLAFNNANLFGARLENALQISDLKNDANKFRGAGGLPNGFQVGSVSGGNGGNGGLFFTQRDQFADLTKEQIDNLKDLQRQVKVIDSQPLFGDKKAQELERAIANQRIISLTQGQNPNELTFDLRNRAAQAREEEARRLATTERDALQAQQQISNQLNVLVKQLSNANGIPVSIANGEQFVRIVNDAPNNAKVSTRPRAADTANRYR